MKKLMTGGKHEDEIELRGNVSGLNGLVIFQDTTHIDCINVIYTPNSKRFGMLVKDVDGFFYFAPQGSGGTWDAKVLHEIADKLDELNYFWEQQVARDSGI